MNVLARKLTTLFSSQAFFWGILGLFVLQSLWLVFSARYPMAFDEEVHVGIIKVYSQQLSPFLSTQNVNSDVFGPIITDPSYLFHYLMSFPYRLFMALTNNEAATIIGMRLINVALFAYSLVVFKKVLRETGLSRALSHVALAIFILVPIVPMLAAHVNYDNLVMVIAAWLSLLGLRIIKQLQAGKADLRLWLAFITLALVGSIVKYALLPIVVAAGLFLFGYIWRYYRGAYRALWQALHRSWRSIRRPMQIMLVAAILVSFGLFAQRYIVNIVKYHHPIPSCDAVLNESRCMAYGPWERNYLLAHSKETMSFNQSPVYYAHTWAYWLHHRLYFAVNGPAPGADRYASRPPLPVPYILSLLVFTASVFLTVIFWRKVFWRNAAVLFLASMILTYCISLFIEDYSQYLETGQPVAINGRYLLPLIMPMAAILGLGIRQAFAKHHFSRYKALTAGAVVFLLLVQGGGAVTFIVRSEPSWNWQNSAVIKANNAARKVLKPLIIEGHGYYR